jgi:hypothetical protein
LKPNLPNEISSLQDLRALIIDVQQYSKWFSQVSVKMKFNKGLQIEQPVFPAPAVQVISQWAGDKPLTKDRLDELIEGLKQVEENAPQISITLAAPASNGLKQSMVKWCRQNMSPDILVNFKFNATILGGMVVNYGSHIYDWSFRRKILANRDKFPEMLRHV